MARRRTSIAACAVLLVGEAQAHLGSVVVDGSRERQALGVVPVQVAEQHRAPEGRFAEQRGRARGCPCPASSTRLGGSPSRASATQDVLPP